MKTPDYLIRAQLRPCGECKTAGKVARIAIKDTTATGKGVAHWIEWECSICHAVNGQKVLIVNTD